MSEAFMIETPAAFVLEDRGLVRPDTVRFVIDSAPQTFRRSFRSAWVMHRTTTDSGRHWGWH